MATVKELIAALDTLLAECNTVLATLESNEPHLAATDRVALIEPLLKRYRDELAPTHPKNQFERAGWLPGEGDNFDRAVLNTTSALKSLNEKFILARTDIITTQFNNAMALADDFIHRLKTPFSDKQAISGEFATRAAPPSNLTAEQNLALTTKDQSVGALITELENGHEQALTQATDARTQFIAQFQAEGADQATLLSEYERNKVGEPFISKFLTFADKATLEIQDIKISQVITVYRSAKAAEALASTSALEPEIPTPSEKPKKDQRVTQLAKTTKPALEAMITKLTELDSRVKIADEKALALATPKNLTRQANIRVAHATAKAACVKFEQLYQDYVDLKIDLKTLQTKTQEVLTTTPWKLMDGSGIDASTILSQHRGNQGKRTWAQWAHEFLKGLGATTLSQFFKPATAKIVEQYVAAVQKEKDNPTPGNK